MTKLLSVLRRTLALEPSEPPVHFHQGTDEGYPEVCYEDACLRPRLKAA